MAKETDYKAVAQQIIEVVGGPENIISVAHCATRLRLIVKNREIIDDKIRCCLVKLLFCKLLAENR